MYPFSHLYLMTRNVIMLCRIFGGTTVLAKYAGHVRQTFADVRQWAQTLPDILSVRIQYTENVQKVSGIKHNICWSLMEKNV